VRGLLIPILIIVSSCSEQDQKEKLFENLYHKTFKPRDWVTIEFVDSASYIILSGVDSVRQMTKGTWRIEDDLVGTYLIMESSKMRLEEISDSVITFTKGEFGSRFIRLKKHGTTKY
jgi:hypothetical protein